MNTQEIAAINFHAWRECIEAHEYTKAQTYSKHLGALGYKALIAPDSYILLREENPVPATLSQRYQMAAYQLRWHESGVSYGIRLRMQYLALLLDTLAHQLQHHPLSFTLDWINTQLDYENTHNVYAQRLLTRVKAHLTGDQKLQENRMQYKLTGKVAIREEDGPGEIVKDHTEIVEASTPEEAIEWSLSGFTKEEEPCWCEGYPVVTPVSN